MGRPGERAILALATLTMLLAACAQPGQRSTLPAADPTTPLVDSTPAFPTPEGESEFPIYLENPQRLTSGKYASPLDTPSERSAGIQAEQEDEAKTKFHGWMDGVFLGGYPYPKELDFFPCSKEDVTKEGTPDDQTDLKESPYWFDPPSYMPPGSFVWTIPYGQSCGSDPAFDIYREFFVDGGGEIAIYRTWRTYFAEDVSEDRIASGEIGGKKAILISPLTPEGHGDTHVIVVESGGTLRVSGFGFPLSEIQKVAEALIGDLS